MYLLYKFKNIIMHVGKYKIYKYRKYKIIEIQNVIII